MEGLRYHMLGDWRTISKEKQFAFEVAVAQDNRDQDSEVPPYVIAIGTQTLL